MKNIFAEVVTIGDEILYGQITDTNTAWISAELDKIGIRTIRKSSVGDQKEAILSILAEAESRAQIILITGGLGPTKDDITKLTMAEYFDSELAINEQALAEVTHFFKTRGRELTELNRMQALQPVKALYVPNKIGTAPGMWFEKEGKLFISMPGVPYEMKEMMRTHVLPRLKQHFEMPVIFHRLVRTVGIGESIIAQKIEDWENALPAHVKLAYLPSIGQVKLRLTAAGDNLETLKHDVENELAKLEPMISKYIYGYDSEELEVTVGRILLEQGKTVALAESCTGGYIGHSLTRIPGSSAYFRGGVVPYHNDLKREQLGVREQTLEQHGAVSEATVIEMAQAVRIRFGADVGMASSGIMGPGGGTDDKPVGTVWIAYADEHKTWTRRLQLGNERNVNIVLAGINVLNLLRRGLLNIAYD
jgi:nicotinamide-nucleotide amidase